MINYILLLLADVLLALSFTSQKIYQKHSGTSNLSGIFYTMIVGFCSSIIFLIISGFDIRMTPYSLLMATAQTSLVALYTILSFKVLKEGNLALYTLFLMTGGMVLPYIFGVLFLKEDLTLLRSIGLLLITGAVILSNLGVKKTSKTQILLCFIIFLLNGGVSIISKLHQIEQGFETVNSDCFVLFTSLIKCIALLPVFLVLKKKSPVAFKPDIKKILPVIVLASVFSGVSYMLQLIGATSLPATVVYPLITGGSIILSSVAGLLILKEKTSKKQITGILICFIGTCLFL